ncbi:hypothetical protein B0H13DRAFT_2277601 [Mycena leptocephala]|nr:hypothetical protein B0H13DRAFT_2277601 [Mycena leptocephala]
MIYTCSPLSAHDFLIRTSPVSVSTPCWLQLIAVPKARIGNLLFWDVFKEFPVSHDREEVAKIFYIWRAGFEGSVITANCSTEGADQKSAVLGRFQRIPGISKYSANSCAISDREEVAKIFYIWRAGFEGSFWGSIQSAGHFNMPRYRQIELTPKMTPQTQLAKYRIFFATSSLSLIAHELAEYFYPGFKGIGVELTEIPGIL